MEQNLLLKARVASRKQLSPSLVELVFEGDELPAAEPGSHVDVHLPNGLVRQYSLVEPVGQGGCYRIGVRVLETSQGGSRCVADSLLEGESVQLSAPRNLFKLKIEDRPIVLVAGGIGITPVHAMAQCLREQNHQNWVLHYVFSQRDDTYFPSDWVLDDERVRLYETSQSGVQLNVDQLVSELERDGGADIYCCGPTSLMDEFTTRCASSSLVRYTQEAFSAPEQIDAAANAEFSVVLAKSGCTFQVPAGQTILEVLQEKGVDVPYSCGQGICGACETQVLAGKPEHRDAILSPGEQESGDTMMICCSRALTPSLTLDL